MSWHDKNDLTIAEKHAFSLIHDLRCQLLAGDAPVDLVSPAHVAHHLISIYHGRVDIRMSKIAPELGVSLRSLQRSFRRHFGTSMRSFQAHVRLRYAQYLLSMQPTSKVSVVAKQLGYDDPNVFERFFRTHADKSPHAWSEAQRARLSHNKY